MNSMAKRSIRFPFSSSDILAVYGLALSKRSFFFIIIEERRALFDRPITAVGSINVHLMFYDILRILN